MNYLIFFFAHSVVVYYSTSNEDIHTDFFFFFSLFAINEYIKWHGQKDDRRQIITRCLSDMKMIREREKKRIENGKQKTRNKRKQEIYMKKKKKIRRENQTINSRYDFHEFTFTDNFVYLFSFSKLIWIFYFFYYFFLKHTYLVAIVFFTWIIETNVTFVVVSRDITVGQIWFWSFYLNFNSAWSMFW